MENLTRNLADPAIRNDVIEDSEYLRGSELSSLQGHYFYSDFCGGFLRSFRYNNGATADEQDWGLNAGAVTSFGQDSAGELYMIVAAGAVLKIVASP